MLSTLEAFAGAQKRDYLVWTEIAVAFRNLLAAWWEDAAMTAGLEAFARDLFEPALNDLGFVGSPDDDPSRRLLRSLVIAAAATAQLPRLV